MRLSITNTITIQGLLPALKSVCDEVHIKAYADKKIGIDAYVWCATLITITITFTIAITITIFIYVMCV
jgi:hypothetical protein